MEGIYETSSEIVFKIGLQFGVKLRPRQRKRALVISIGVVAVVIFILTNSFTNWIVSTQELESPTDEQVIDLKIIKDTSVNPPTRRIEELELIPPKDSNPKPNKQTTGSFTSQIPSHHLIRTQRSIRKASET